MLKSNTLKINTVDDGLIYLTFPNIESAGGATAAFTTRMGGVSRGKYASMNMSFTNGDSKSDVRENYNIIFSKLGLDPEKAVLSHQTHTSNLMVVTENDAGKGIVSERTYNDIDGLITNCRGIALVTQYADCVPLLFYDPKKRVVASSHAGWRGTVAKIGEKTVKKMKEQFGCEAKDILAAIGPSIGKCCYEVDTPVYNEFIKSNIAYIEKAFTAKGGGKYMLDLQLANRLVLLKSGIKEENLCVTDLCTCCHSEYFHSHRATAGSRGNLAAIIALKEK